MSILEGVREKEMGWKITYTSILSRTMNLFHSKFTVIKPERNYRAYYI